MDDLMWTIAGALVLGIIINELWDLSSVPAKRIVSLAARLWTRDAEQAEIYAEEWRAHIEERPGRLLKLFTALSLLGAATVRHLRARLHQPKPDISLRRAEPIMVLRRLGMMLSREDGAAVVAVFLSASLLSTVTAWALLGSSAALRIMTVGYGVVAFLAIVVVSDISSFLVRERRSTRAFREDLEVVMEDLAASRVALRSTRIGQPDDRLLSGTSLVRPYAAVAMRLPEVYDVDLGELRISPYVKRL